MLLASSITISIEPVRLMQRIGRVDRRLIGKAETAILKDHPEQKPIRRQSLIGISFLLMNLTIFETLSEGFAQDLRISKTLALKAEATNPRGQLRSAKRFIHKYDGTTTAAEEMHLEYQKLMGDYPDLAAASLFSRGAFLAEKNIRRKEHRLFSFATHCQHRRRKHLPKKKALKRNGRRMQATRAGTFTIWRQRDSRRAYGDC